MPPRECSRLEREIAGSELAAPVARQRQEQALPQEVLLRVQLSEPPLPLKASSIQSRITAATAASSWMYETNTRRADAAIRADVAMGAMVSKWETKRGDECGRDPGLCQACTSPGILAAVRR